MPNCSAAASMACLSIFSSSISMASSMYGVSARLTTKPGELFTASGSRSMAVKSSPGFVVNRALTPYMLEAMLMLDENIDKHAIDAAAEQFGMPMGPIELADQVGLDICLAV